MARSLSPDLLLLDDAGLETLDRSTPCPFSSSASAGDPDAFVPVDLLDGPRRLLLRPLPDFGTDLLPESPVVVGSDFVELAGGAESEDREIGWGGDDFFLGRRRSASDSIEFSRAFPVDSEGLRIAGFDSDSDSDEQIIAIAEDPGLLRLRWDCLQLEDQRTDPIEEFEWEEVTGERSDDVRELNDQDLELPEHVSRNLEWEVLMAVNSLGRNPLDPEDVEAYFVEDQEGFVYTSDQEPFELLVGQLADHDSFLKARPPAAKSAVDSLLSVVFTQDDVAMDDIQCAVCKDGIMADQRVKRLPCSHHYHEDCILPWLGIRNSCPLCRYELPTDDPEYEKWRAARADGVDHQDESPVFL